MIRKGFASGKAFKKATLLCAAFYFSGMYGKFVQQSSEHILPLKKAFKQVEKQTGYSFFYNNSEIDSGKSVTLDHQINDISEIIRSLNQQTGLRFEIVGQQIIISPTPTKKEVVQITGQVLDKNGNPLEGAEVYAEGTAYRTLTDENGRYRLDLPDDRTYVLVFKYDTITHKTEINPATNRVYNMVMDEKVQAIEEVVLIGYGSKARGNVTSSVSSINTEKLENLAASNSTVDNMLGGTMKGVRLNQSSGEPGATATINVRGVTSPYPNLLRDQESNIPLYVIDGMPIFVENNTLNPLLSIAASDIESIDVLKDAAATVIYGSRGANGVIIIKTKGGRKNGKMQVDLDYAISVSNPIKQYNPLTTDEFKNHQDLILRNTVDAMNTYDSNFIPGSFASDYELNILGDVEYTLDPDTYMPFYIYHGLRQDAFGTANTNWVKETTKKNAITHQYNAALRGGSQNADYSLSFNGMNQEGTTLNDFFERYGIRSAVNYNISPKLKVGTILNYSFSERKSPSAPSFMGNSYPWLARPDFEVYDAAGNFIRLDESASNYGLERMAANPVALLQRKSDFKNNQMIGSANLDYEILTGLTLHSDLTLLKFDYDNSYFLPKVSRNIDYFEPFISTLDTDFTKNNSSSVNFRLDYKKKFGLHNFSALGGYGIERSATTTNAYSYEGFPDDEHLINSGSAERIVNYTQFSTKSGLNSLYSRISYDYDAKYLAEISMRADKSSKFGPGNRWGYFPAISLAWRMNKENFLAENSNVNDLKLRTSWGKTGSTNVPDFAYKQYFSRTSSSLYGPGIAIEIKDLLPNENLKWEMTTEYNNGLDFSLFGRRLFGSLDVYYRYTDGALAPAPHIAESGIKTYYDNIIDMSNRGYELEMGGFPIKKQDFSWELGFNISSNRNRIENLNGASINPYFEDMFIQGQPAGTMKGYLVDRILQSDAEIDQYNQLAQQNGFDFYQESGTRAGDYLFKDLNGDGRITSADRTVIVNPEPKFFGGFNTTFTFKNFSLFALMQFSKGANALWTPLLQDLGATLGQSVGREVYNNTWTPENPDARYAKLVNNSTVMMNSYINDRFVFDTSYLRLKNVTLSYNLPKDFVSKLKINHMSLNITGTNLFTWTKWPGLDPELIGTGTTLMGSNGDPYPLSKSFTFGTKITF